MTAPGRHAGWAVLVRREAGQELANTLAELVIEGLDHHREVAAVVPSGEGGFVVVFRPRTLLSAPSHVTATLVDRNGYPR